MTHQDFGSTGTIQIQGSQDYQTLVLVDGVRWNFVSGNNAATNDIPVRIIERIEVIKGPASSTWGSALGGVINIVTKNTGRGLTPETTAAVSLGERNTWDFGTEVAGKTGVLGYYLFGGGQQSEGLWDDRYFYNEHFYGKFDFGLPRDMKLGVTAGYTDPTYRIGDFPGWDLMTRGSKRNFWITATFDTRLTNALGLTLSAHAMEKKQVDIYDSFGAGLYGYGPVGNFIWSDVWDEEKKGATARLVWTGGRHTAVFGAEIERGEMEYVGEYSATAQAAFGYPAEDRRPRFFQETTAFFLNDTAIYGDLTVTPGVRYDSYSISGETVNPSLGMTYRLADSVLLRASAARGFNSPAPSYMYGGGRRYVPDPTLEPETVWSFQAGVEAAAVGYGRIKATGFHHEVRNGLVQDPVTFIVINAGKSRRRGIELEAESESIHHFSVQAGLAWAYEETYSNRGNDYSYTINLGLSYDDGNGLKALLLGYYVWWSDIIVDPSAYSHDYDFVWDLSAQKRIFGNDFVEVELFGTAHNLFSGAQYWDEETYKNPRRWVEGGVRMRF